MLRISQTYAQIGIQTQRGQLNINTTQPKLNMQQEHVQVEIETELPRVHIDQYQCFAEAGLKNNADLAKEVEQLAKKQLMKYINKKTSESERLLQIYRGGNPFAEFAKRDAYETKQFNVDVIPKSRPKIEVTGEVKTSFRPGGVQFSAQNGIVDIQATRSNVDIYLKQRQSIQIQYVGNNVDTQL